MKFIPVHIRDIFLPIKDIEDKIYNGWQYYETKRPIYKINEINVFNDDLYIKSSNNIYIRLLGTSINTDEFIGKKNSK